VNKESKKGFGGLFIDEEDVTMITWTLAMQKVGLFINLQQLKLKVGKLIQTKPIQSRNGVFKNASHIGSNITTLNLTFVK
jgi:hypothetical protein